MTNEIMVQNRNNSVFATEQAFEIAQRKGTALSKSTLVPKEYQNNLPNCLIALEIAGQIGASPLMVCQNLYIVHGRPSWSSQFVIASINSCGRFKPLRFDFSGQEGTDDWACTAWTVERDIEFPAGIRTLQQAVDADLPVLKSAKISIKMAKAEGWYGKSGSKWQTMPEQMMQYRSASFFGRIYAPDVLMGMYTEHEARDMIDVTPREPVAAEGKEPAEEAAPNIIDSINATIEQAGATSAAHTLAQETKSEPINEPIKAEPIGDNQLDKKEKPVFDIGSHNLTEPGGARKAAEELLGLLKPMLPEHRPQFFTKWNGFEITDALSKQGLMVLRNKFKDLGIRLMENAA